MSKLEDRKKKNNNKNRESTKKLQNCKLNVDQLNPALNNWAQVNLNSGKIKCMTFTYLKQANQKDYLGLIVTILQMSSFFFALYPEIKEKAF